MPQGVLPNLHFFYRQKNLARQVTKEQKKAATNIINQCRQTMSLITSDREKEALGLIIVEVSRVIETAPLPKKAAELEAHLNQLQVLSNSLPKQFEQRANIASTSYNVAKACVFMLALSFALAVGFAFYCWYFHYAMTYVLDYLVEALSAIGLPGAVLGLFSYFMYSKNSDQAAEVDSLQKDIADFSEDIAEAHLDVIEDEEDVEQLAHTT